MHASAFGKRTGLDVRLPASRMSRHGIQSERQAKLKLENQLAVLRALKKQMRRLSQLRSDEEFAQTHETMIEESAPSPREAQRRYAQSRSGRIQFVIRFHLFG